MLKNGRSVDCSLDILIDGYRDILGKEEKSLTDNAEFMHLTELHFLLKKLVFIRKYELDLPFILTIHNIVFYIAFGSLLTYSYIR